MLVVSQIYLWFDSYVAVWCFLAGPTRKALITLLSFSFASLARIYEMQCDVISCIDSQRIDGKMKGRGGSHGKHLKNKVTRTKKLKLTRPKSFTVHTKSVSRPRGCRRRNTKTRKRENPKTAETPSTKTGKNENAKTAKTRKRENGKNAKSRKAVFAESKKTLQSIIALAIKDARRWEKHKKMETRKLENGKKCSRFLVVWFCTEAVHSAAL